jgi:hypothetical protein
MDVYVESTREHTSKGLKQNKVVIALATAKLEEQ